MHTRALSFPCEYPGCSQTARMFNEGGLFCAVPHPPVRKPAGWMSNEPDWAVYVERGGPSL